MPTLDITLIERALDVPEPTIIDKSERLLEECGRRTKHFRQNVFDPCEPLLAITWSADANELRYLVHLLREQEYLISSVVSDSIVLSAQGITKVEAQRDKIITDQAFVAMSFGAELDSVYDKGLYIGIKSAGYKPFRMDRHDHVNRIDDEMISQIRQSRFTVADFTGKRQSVYFEAGLALGLGQHVIWTCKKSEIEHLHFDVRQYSTIDWEDEDNLSKKVQSRIEAVLGPGPNR